MTVVDWTPHHRGIAKGSVVVEPNTVFCAVCKRRLRPQDQWITPDGKQVWCADCWGQQFPAGPAGPAVSSPRIVAGEPVTAKRHLAVVRPVHSPDAAAAALQALEEHAAKRGAADGIPVAETGAPPPAPAAPLPRAAPGPPTGRPPPTAEPPVGPPDAAAALRALEQQAAKRGARDDIPLAEVVSAGPSPAAPVPPVAPAVGVPAGRWPPVAASPGEGAPPPLVAPPRPLSTRPKTSGLAVTALVCGLVGIFCVGAGAILGAAAAISGVAALNAIAGDPNLKGRVMAVAGLITGLIDIVGWVALMAIYGLF